MTTLQQIVIASIWVVGTIVGFLIIRLKVGRQRIWYRGMGTFYLVISIFGSWIWVIALILADLYEYKFDESKRSRDIKKGKIHGPRWKLGDKLHWEHPGIDPPFSQINMITVERAIPEKDRNGKYWAYVCRDDEKRVCLCNHKDLWDLGDHKFIKLKKPE